MKLLFRWLKPFRFTILIILISIFTVFSIQITEFNVYKLVVSAPKAGKILKEFLIPDLFTQSTESLSFNADFPVPCGSAAESAVKNENSGIELNVPCGNVGDSVKVTCRGLEKNTQVIVWWVFPDGKRLSAGKFTTDEAGEFQRDIEIRPIVATKDGKPAKIEAEVSLKSQKLMFSDTVKEVVDSMMVTIFMALLATTLGTICAVPLGFLAASNISKHGFLGNIAYYVTRFVLNLIRAYEPLVMATVFALIVGYGTPFAGILALIFVTIASLGKMFSEAVENIDPGPVEALKSTGANWIQVVIYAVIPQIIPEFLSYVIYHWDINVRASTIIGFVGGGGIGFYLSQRINSFDYSKAGTAIYAIILVVWILDFISAKIRSETI